MADQDCIFCGIVAGDLPATIISVDERTVAFMDANPIARGHCLVVPKTHSDDIVGADPLDMAACISRVQLLGQRALDGLGADGVAVVNFCRAAAGQTVFHTHFHVIPRYEGDPIALQWTPLRSGDADISAAAEALSA